MLLRSWKHRLLRTITRQKVTRQPSIHLTANSTFGTRIVRLKPLFFKIEKETMTEVLEISSGRNFDNIMVGQEKPGIGLEKMAYLGPIISKSVG